MSDTPLTPSATAENSAARVIVPRKLKWYHHFFAFVIFAGFRLLSLTWRCRYIDIHGFMNEPHGPRIFSLWHNRLALSMTIWERFGRKTIYSPALAALISASHDGGVLARVLSYFKVAAVRGSSSRRGPQALLELTGYIERHYSIAITPDGPRGPRYVVQDGIIALAQISGAPIMPISAVIRGKIILKSWDRFQIPLPFGRCEVRIGLPLKVPREVNDEQRAELKAELQKRMMALTED